MRQFDEKRFRELLGKNGSGYLTSASSQELAVETAKAYFAELTEDDGLVQCVGYDPEVCDKFRECPHGKRHKLDPLTCVIKCDECSTPRCISCE